VPHRVPNLAQTRHGRYAWNGRTGSNSDHRRAQENAVLPFPGDQTHDKLVNKKPRFGPFSGRTRRPSGSRVLPNGSIPSVCSKAFPNLSELLTPRPAGGEK
jgi:hypothetical protein